jgi:hypothetical protein
LTDPGVCLTYSKLGISSGEQCHVLMPFELTPAFLLAIGAVIGTIGAAMGPETKDVDFH